MLQFVLVFAGFLAGEILIYFLVSRGYDRLAAKGTVPLRRGVKHSVLLIALLLPAAYAAIALFGVLLVSTSPGISLPQLAGIPPPGPITPIAPEPFTPTAEPAPSPGEVVLTPVPTSASPDSPEIEGQIPDGQIVYVCQIFRTGLRDQICLMNSDGTDHRRISLEDDWDYNFPSLAPDGNSVIYAAKAPEGIFEIYEQELDGEDVRQLTEEDGDTSAPEISPDGSLIVFNRITDEANTIWVMDRDGSNQHMVYGLPEGHGWDPVWSPDGERILFASDRAVGVQLFTIDREGGDLQQITDLRLLRGRGAWSPGGIGIATYAGQPWLREIVMMDPDGSNPRLITSGGNNLAPSFSPDGQWITFTSYRDNYRDELGCEIYVMRIDGNNITRLTDNDICDWQPRWGPR